MSINHHELITFSYCIQYSVVRVVYGIGVIELYRTNENCVVNDVCRFKNKKFSFQRHLNLLFR